MPYPNWIARDLKSNCTAIAVAAINSVAHDDNKSSSFDAVRRDLDEGGETLKFSVIPSEIDHFLDTLGFQLVEMATPESIEREIIPTIGAPIGIIPNWHLLLAEGVTV